MKATATRQINMAIPEDLYQRAKLCAAQAPSFFKAWVTAAIEAAVVRAEKKAGK